MRCPLLPATLQTCIGPTGMRRLAHSAVTAAAASHMPDGHASAFQRCDNSDLSVSTCNMPLSRVDLKDMRFCLARNIGSG